MPGMDGLELTREIKRLHPDIRVILSSGRVDREDSVAFEKIGYISQAPQAVHGGNAVKRHQGCAATV